MSNIQLKNITKSFGKLQTIHGIDLDIQQGEFVVFVGPSGCGKSTVLRLIAGLEEITSGDLVIDGEVVNDLPPAKRGIAMVFQSYALYPHMTVYDNMAFGLELAKFSKEDIDKRVREVAGILELTPLLDRLPKAMSGGQRQRVAIGRAIVRNPKVFLFDEPLSNLDASLRVQMRIEISKLHREMEVTMIYVTHDQVEAMTLADKIVVLRAGRIEQVGAPLELYHYPANQFVAGFIGSPQMNFITAKVKETSARGVLCELPKGGTVLAAVDPAGVKVGEEVTLGVRPEHTQEQVGEHETVTGTIELLEQLGEAHFIYLKLDHGERIIVREPDDTQLKLGERISIGIPANRCHVFTAEGKALPRAR